jgi:hypothetical protein
MRGRCCCHLVPRSEGWELESRQQPKPDGRARARLDKLALARQGSEAHTDIGDEVAFMKEELKRVKVARVEFG